MRSCYLCDKELSIDKISKEHILLNSIGGQLKSKDLLCKECNSKFGYKADSELAKQLSFFSNILGVKRDSGVNPSIKGGKTKKGKEYHLLDGGKPRIAKPEFKEIERDGKKVYSLFARNEKELLNMLKGLKKKHPNLDLETAKQKFKWKEEYLDEPIIIDTTIGGKFAFKSIVKSAVNYYVYTQKEKKQIKHLIDYLKENEDLYIVKHYHPHKSIYKKESNEIIHLIHLNGNKDSKLLYCFIEFFSSYSFIVLLSENYTGKNFTSSYCYNVMTNNVVTKDVKLNLNKEKIGDIFNSNKKYFDAIILKSERVMKIANRIQLDKEKI